MGPPVVLLPGQSAGKKDSHSSGDFPAHSEPASSSSGPASVPGLPVTEGELPIQQTPLPEPTPEPPVPETAEDTDSDATVDYREREDSLLALPHTAQPNGNHTESPWDCPFVDPRQTCPGTHNKPSGL